MMSQLVGILSFPIQLNSYLQPSLLEVPVLHLFKGSQTIFIIPALILRCCCTACIGNNTWAHIDMEFLFECLTRWLTSERSQVEHREIPYLQATMYTIAVQKSHFINE